MWALALFSRFCASEAKKRAQKCKGQWCKIFGLIFFASNSSFGSHWAQGKTALNKFEF
jgi:hypothetical protein